MSRALPNDDERVLLLSPLHRDRSLARELLMRAGFAVETVEDMTALAASARVGAGMLLVAAESLFNRELVAELTDLLHNQPPWSDLPVVLITHSRIADPHELRALRGLEHLHSVTFLDRPVRIAALVSTVRTALQARSRQYQVRDLIRTAEDGMRQRDEFLAMLSHELRNPLASITNAVQVLQIDPTRVSHITGVLSRQVSLLSHMVDDLLDVGRLTSGKVTLKDTRFDIAEPLRAAMETMGTYVQERNHQLQVHTTEQPLPVHGDAARLAQVFGNLIHNAAKYTEPGGQIEVRLTGEGHHAVLRIRDSGVGIAPEQLPRIFDLFAQAERDLDRSDGGLGIGLTVARRLVEMHGGELNASSEGIGKGSEFQVRVPLAKHQHDTLEAAANDGADGTCRVLVVDDNPAVADGLALLVEALGHEVMTLYSGNEVLPYVTQYQPDVVFLDIGMPETDGYTVARSLRNLPGRPHMNVVALTGYGDLDTVRRCHAAGFDQHLLKPADLASLKAILRESATGIVGHAQQP